MKQDELRHHGVPGMKWGVRKAKRSDDSSRVKNIRKKKIKEMSNQELKDVNNRLQLENQYRDLSRKSNAGNRAVKTFIATAGTLTAVTAATVAYKKFGGKVKGVVNNSLNAIGDWVVKGIKF